MAIMRAVLILLVLAVVISAMPAPPTAENIDSIPGTLSSQDLDLIKELTNSDAQHDTLERPARASPLAHIIADIIDIKYQIGRAIFSRIFSVPPHTDDK